MDMLHMMASGAATLASYGKEHTPKHAAAGFSAADWRLLTQDQRWSEAERRKLSGIIAEAVNCSLHLAGLPAGTLPAEFVAATITQLVHPCNRLVGALAAPDSFQAVAASGVIRTAEIQLASRETMLSLVQAYTSGWIEGFPGPLYGSLREDEEVKHAAQDAKRRTK